MEKIRPHLHNGTEYLLIFSLPYDQLIHFQDWLGIAEILIIEESDGFSYECVPYGVYDFWYDTAREEIQYENMAIF